ncbi:MAG: pseudouridine synthase [Candidatus Omnitrophica bacterium CG11_big_fil_rev_8_21_14_0_20_64_10]|nr:MAG: pseudouridine synthase [Candidatus Omnitrophica bacterium CG11_big_fil_rev_8_21_14_0_20_64_10]
MRIARALALAGVDSRRKCEVLVSAGRVTVDGEPVTDLARQVDPAVQEIRLDGRPLSFGQAIYYLFHKPAGVTTTAADPHAARTLYDALPAGLRAKGEGRVFPVGRLDRETTGLLLLTSDGELANRMTHPRHQVERVYEARLDRPPAPADLERLARGVQLEDGPARPKTVRRGAGGTVRLTLCEGRKREVRRLFEAIGYSVTRLKRTAFGPLELGDLPEGAGRFLSEAEVAWLKREVKG